MLVSQETWLPGGLTEARKMPHSSEQFQNALPQEPTLKDFLGGPVVRTPWSQGRGSRFNPSQETSSHMPQPKARMLQLRWGAAKIKTNNPPKTNITIMSTTPLVDHLHRALERALWAASGASVSLSSNNTYLVGWLLVMRQLLSVGFRPSHGWIYACLLPSPSLLLFFPVCKENEATLPSSPLPPGWGPLCAQILPPAF